MYQAPLVPAVNMSEVWILDLSRATGWPTLNTTHVFRKGYNVGINHKVK